ncbi:unnamed protein product [Cylindrotheca closterium]|uniref:Uncharacterized protein n=1 Tax=Cylindrotheca closterium TaxID=2856 RepID=A0AAD2GB80_9STRA|nr:unnamed protein product [Cylindrotheca closterium]
MMQSTKNKNNDDDERIRRIAAFFDFDKTLIALDSAGKEATTVLATKYDAYHHYPLLWTGLIVCTLLNPLVERNYMQTETLNLIYYYCCYRNLSVNELQGHAQDLYLRLLKPAVYQEILNEMQEHQRKGHLVVLLSATSEHLIEPFAKEYKVDVCISTKIIKKQTVHSKRKRTKGDNNNNNNDNDDSDDSDDDDDDDAQYYYTGVVDGKVCCQKTKSDHVHRLAQEYNLNLQKSFAYSDHHHDIPLLESVGNPSVVHPTSLLEQEAKKRDWPILRPIIPEIVIAMEEAKQKTKKTKDEEQDSSLPKTMILFGIGILGLGTVIVGLGLPLIRSQ